MKHAYPNNDAIEYYPTNYDIEKWIKAFRDAYTAERNGISRKDAFQKITSRWSDIERFDFLNWVKYYQEGNQLKYKTAQNWYENGAPGYFLHLKPDPKPAPKEELHVEDFQEDLAKKEQKKQIIEMQRQKIIGRLDSAEKLLRSQDGQTFAGNELEELMEAIYSLKKKVQLVNKMSSSVRLYEDMIVREGNVLNRKGFQKAANILYSVADEADLNATAPPMPTENQGAPGGLPATIPGVPNVQTSSFNDQNKDQPTLSALKEKPKALDEKPVDNTPKSKGIQEFLVQMNTAGDTDQETLDDKNDVLEVEDEELMVTEAQEAPAPLQTPANAPPATEAPIEVSEEDVPTDAKADEEKGSIIDQKIDQALANITIDDVIAKLEDLSMVFKVREIPRQLSLIDIMLQNLGLASYFSNLSEAQNKALDSNNYISTRVDDILAKLRGAVTGGSGVDLTGGTEESNPEVQAVKNKLQMDADKEKTRKENRKAQEDAEISTPDKETPNVDIQGDLGASPKPSPAPLPPTVPKA